MRKLVLAVMILSTRAANAQSPPGIGQNGVVNSASQIPPTLPGGAIARGALFSIYGVRLGSPRRTIVTISQMPVRILQIVPRRIDAWMPESAPLGSHPLLVTVDGTASKPFAVEVVSSNPGIFSRNREGWGPGRIEGNSTSNPAQPGQRVTLATTGLGNAKDIRVVIGNRVTKAARTGKATRGGEDEIAFQIPADAPQGCYVPVYLEVTPTRASNVVTMSIRAGPGPCETGAIPQLSVPRVSVVMLSRTRMLDSKKRDPESILDDARITFNSNDVQNVQSPIRLLPPAGTCAAYTSSYQSNTELTNSISSIIGPEGRGFDAGSMITLSGGNQVRPMPENRRAIGNYRARLGAGGSSQGRGTPLLFLGPGEYVLRGNGGRDVGPFTLTLAGPVPVEWTDREATAVVDRSRGVTVHWRDPARGRLILIGARNIDQITTAIGMCICTARSEAGRFTIPAAMLANVPASQDIPGVPYDQLVIGALRVKPGLVAQGLNGGVVFSVYAVGRIVEFR